VIEVLRQSVAAQIAHLQAQPEVDAFHRLWYEHAGLTWGATRWLGVPMMKNPLDLWVQQDLIVDLKPGLIIETGTWYGGSALFFANVCDLLGHGQVVSVDVRPPPGRFEHPRITLLTGSSVDPEIVARVQGMVPPDQPVLVILDSDHSPEHVAAELEAYAPLVTPGSYLIVEDTNCGGRPVENEAWAPRGGPYVAVEAFLEDHPEFVQDPLCEHYLLTCHPGGWLRRRP
jgi:cephalosporin hydroxylase